MTVLITIVLGMFGSILAAELSGICPPLSRKLLVRAARRLPEEVRDRYIAEWHGDLDYLRANRGGVSVLLWALGVYVSSYRLAKVAQAQEPTTPVHAAIESEVPRLAGGAENVGSARFDLLDSFYEYLLEAAFDQSIWQVVQRALMQIGRAPRDSRTLLLNDVVVYVKYVPGAVVQDKNLPGLLLAYTFDRSANVVRPFFVSATGTTVTTTDRVTNVDDESLLRRLLLRALGRLARHREH